MGRHLIAAKTMRPMCFLFMAVLCHLGYARHFHPAAYKWGKQMGEESLQKNLYAGNNFLQNINKVTSYPWKSYPPPIPLWAINKPRREFRPFFGMFSVPLKPSSPLSTPLQPDCMPDTVTGNLPISCIAIIQALRDNDVNNLDSGDL